MRKRVSGYLLAVTVLLAGCASVGNEQRIERQLALSAEERLAFDRVFFNEIWLWNQASWYYGIPSEAKRQKDFEAMATKGYLPAYVALKMFDFEKKIKHPDKQAFELLRQAADAGDISSGCALMPIWAWNTIEGYPRSYEWAKPYVERGRKAKHFACQGDMALLYRERVVAPQDDGEELRELLRSAQAGYTQAFLALSVRASKPSRFYRGNLDRHLCWESASSLYTPWLAIDWDFFNAAAEGAYPQLGLSDEQRVETSRLIKKWKGRMKAANAIMDIVNECIVLEGGVR